VQVAISSFRIVSVCDCELNQDDIKELKRQVELQMYQVSQMKEEISFKDAVISKCNLARVNVEKEMETLKVRQLTRWQQRLNE